MLVRASAVEFIRPMKEGRTSPILIACEKPDGNIVEVVAKFSACCDQGTVNLAREAIAACLAYDLNLPIPEPFWVDILPEWIESIPDAVYRKRIAASVPVAFGSRMITGQYSAWAESTPISEAMVDTAAAILAFDGIIQNPDRRVGNPNCLVRGEQIRIIDHELCFSHGVAIGWRPPWVVGALNNLEMAGNHIFHSRLKKVVASIDFGAIEAAWSALSQERVAEYQRAVAPEWVGTEQAVQSALGLIGSARENIRGCVAEIRRVLT